MSVLVIGVGNDARGDDGIGPAVARALAADPPPGLTVRIVGSDPLALLDAWTGHPHVIVVDALAGSSPGRIHHLAPDAPLVRRALASSHGMGLADSLALARAFGRVPAQLEILAIEGTAFEIGAPPGREVARAGSDLARRLKERFAPAGSAEATSPGVGRSPTPTPERGSTMDS